MSNRVEIPIVVLTNETPDKPVAGASVTIKVRTGEALASIYSEPVGGTSIPQPLTTDTYGRIKGWIGSGGYKATIEVPGKSAINESFDIVSGMDGTFEAVMLAEEAITLPKVSSGLKDAAANSPSLRSIGSGEKQLIAGNDSRMADTRTPTNLSVTAAKVAGEVVGTSSKFAAAEFQTLELTGPSKFESIPRPPGIGGGAVIQLEYPFVPETFSNVFFSPTLSKTPSGEILVRGLTKYIAGEQTAFGSGPNPPLSEYAEGGGFIPVAYLSVVPSKRLIFPVQGAVQKNNNSVYEGWLRVDITQNGQLLVFVNGTGTPPQVPEAYKTIYWLVLDSIRYVPV